MSDQDTNSTEELSDYESTECHYCGDYIDDSRDYCSTCSDEPYCAGCITICDSCGTHGCSGCGSVSQCYDCGKNVCYDKKCSRCCKDCGRLPWCRNCICDGNICPDCDKNSCDESSCDEQEIIPQLVVSDEYKQFFANPAAFNVESADNVVKSERRGRSIVEKMYKDPSRKLPKVGDYVLHIDCRCIGFWLGQVLEIGKRYAQVRICACNPNFKEYKEGTVEKCAVNTCLLVTKK